MTANAVYQTVSIDPIDDGEEMPDVHLFIPTNPDAKKDDPDYGRGLKLDLPNLNNAELPIELVQAILLIKSRPTLSDEETSACMAAFLAYFQAMKPNFWNVLRKTERPIAYLIATVKAWAEESGLDPKAFTSPTSGTTTARR